MTVPNTQPDAGLLAPGPQAPVSRRVGRELIVGLPLVAGCALLGLVMAGLWVWLAPQVPLVVHGNQVLYVDPEGEQRAGADSVFVLIGAGLGILTAAAAFLVTRRRGGGIAVAVALALGGLLGSWIGWQVGVHLGPTADVVAHAKKVGDGHTFTEALALEAKGALLVWSLTAMVVLLGLFAAFGKREQDPPPYWAGPQWTEPAGVLPHPDASDASAPETPVAEAPITETPVAEAPKADAPPAEQPPSGPADLGADGTRQTH